MGQTILKRWTAPSKNDARILGMPNIHPALFGLAPRAVMGAARWNTLRKRCYYKAGYTCEICGEELGPGACEAHEYYTTDYAEGTQEFVRLICLCHRCHQFIHSGRMLTLYKNRDKYTTKRVVLGTIEHGFKVISEWNKTHEEQILVYDAIQQYTKVKELVEPIQELIDKYQIKFYKVLGAKAQAPWEKWRMIYGGIEHYTKYKDHQELEAEMAERDIKEGRRQLPNSLKGGIFDEIDKTIDEEENN